MQSKQVELIHFMMENKGKAVTSWQLAGALSISVRSVKTYISQINELGKGRVIRSNKNGVNGKYFPAKNGNYFPALFGK